MAGVNCDSPVLCENGAECMKGYACFTGSNGKKECDDIARYQCRKGCEDGYVLNPLRFCECIKESDRDAMFCADGAAQPAEATESEEETSAPMIQKITCPDGQMLNCFTNNK